jgi:hypothetical protein
MAVRLSTLPGTHLCYRLSKPGAVVKLEELAELKNINDYLWCSLKFTCDEYENSCGIFHPNVEADPFASFKVEYSA